MAVVIGDPLHEACGEAAMVDLVGADDLPLPPELAPGGEADPDRSHAWRDHEADERSDEIDEALAGGDVGPIDTDESYAAYVAYCERAEMRACLYPFGGGPRR